MKLSIAAWRAGTMISLSDVLEAIGHDAVVARHWVARNVEAAGNPEPAAEIEAASDRGTSVSGQRLTELAWAGIQVFEGSLIGTIDGGGRSLTVEAIDGSHWDVEGDDQSLRRFVQRFPGAEVLEP